MFGNVQRVSNENFFESGFVDFQGLRSGCNGHLQVGDGAKDGGSINSVVVEKRRRAFANFRFKDNLARRCPQFVAEEGVMTWGLTACGGRLWGGSRFHPVAFALERVRGESGFAATVGAVESFPVDVRS